ncbi:MULTISPECIES: helix-turn-helix transcriptional regulator [Acinetobacter]|uniref:helix-turn-helix transcriptional regulator n=1 Tax=Acinetobacter TaxID=469 RepID=UPI000CDC2A2F|nr:MULTISPECIES: helix-turn-helix transcriptional regulator [Acinetobacter]HAB43968.1 transcriptional regulator [Acinetobacter sp.]AUX89426.1 transcriptional regulator [Acinetobacter sp. ACNIH1]MCU4363792.1 helix-turn-helix transcriptional regulator [Acinetobacter variabilis]MCU4373923.1 helix-turn-helix transcriptional regulator [Acinetobacter variabilis]QKW83058.1 helix-turn-helix transcriptional regulator [Acinetobacter sp. FDAARGOS_724]
MLKNDIIVFRAKKRWTQQQLADAVAVSRQTITALEKEKYNPSLILAFKLANVLETTIEELFSYAEEET